MKKKYNLIIKFEGDTVTHVANSASITVFKTNLQFKNEVDLNKKIIFDILI